MRSTVPFLIVIALLLTAPAALAGPGASASSLEASDGCTESGEGHSGGGNGTYYGSYEHREACRSTTTYASASATDDQGQLVGAYAEANEWEEQAYRETWYSESDRDSDDSWSSYSYENEEGWDRRAGAETTVASAEASRGCQESWSHEGWDSHHSQSSEDRYTSYSSSEEETRYDDRCSETVSASHAGRDAEAGHVDRCGYEREQDRSSSYESYQPAPEGGDTTNETGGTTNDTEDGGNVTTASHDGGYTYSSYRSSTRTTETCRDGVVVDGPTGAMYAGTANECERYDRESSSYYSDDGGSYWYESSYSESECFSGVLVEGPSDASLKAGQETETWQRCETDDWSSDCHAWNSTRYGAEASWRSSPAGPVERGTWIDEAYVPIID